MRSSSLGSSLAAIETAGRQQSAAATHRMNLRIITPLRAEDRLSYYASIDHLMLLDRLAISVPGTEAAVIRHFQKRIPYVLFVPEADAGAIE
jgi:hypothetical protein